VKADIRILDFEKAIAERPVSANATVRRDVKSYTYELLLHAVIK